MAVVTVDALVAFIADLPNGGVVLDLLDVSTGRWLSRPVPGSHHWPTLTANGTRLLVIGNGDVSDAVDIYDTSSSVWTSAQLSTPRKSPLAVSVGSRTLVPGGLLTSSTTSSPSDVVDVFDFGASVTDN